MTNIHQITLDNDVVTPKYWSCNSDFDGFSPDVTANTCDTSWQNAIVLWRLVMSGVCDKPSNTPFIRDSMCRGPKKIYVTMFYGQLEKKWIYFEILP